MEQIITKDGEPLLQLLPVKSDRDGFTLKRHCPFIGLEQDSETIMAYPTLRNRCHRQRLPQGVRPDYQRTHCLTFAHRHCPVLLGSSAKTLPSNIASKPTRRRSIFMIVGFTSIFMVFVAALLLFGGWQPTSASGWFFDPGNEPTQQELIDTPEVQEANPIQSAPDLFPTDFQPAVESLPVETPAADQVSAPTPSPSSET